MGYSRKKNKQRGLRTLKPCLEFFYLVQPGNSRQIKATPLEIEQNCITSLEIPHNFFLVTPGNSICYFFDTLLEIPYPQATMLGFFLEQPNVRRVCIFFHLILVVISSILILSVKNRAVGFFLLNGQNPLSVTKVICQQSLN